MTCDKIKLTVQRVAVRASLGVWGYYYFADTALVLRVLMVLGGLLAAPAWPGRRSRARSSSRSRRSRGRRPAACRGRRARKRCRRPAIVFAFVVVMALFLFAVDSTLAWLVKLMTGRVE